MEDNIAIPTHLKSRLEACTHEVKRLERENTRLIESNTRLERVVLLGDKFKSKGKILEGLAEMLIYMNEQLINKDNLIEELEAKVKSRQSIKEILQEVENNHK